MADPAPPPGATQGRAPLVTEVRTFLIADVRGYTRFTQQYGDEAGARLQTRFGSVTRECVTDRGGKLQGMWGDEALVVFESARQAIRAAVDLQARYAQATRENPRLPLRVGIGLDVGEAVLVDEGYQGGALNLAARLCKLAGPGEVLASDGVVHLARKVEGITYVERGLAELKGFEDKVHVLEVLAETALAARQAEVPPEDPALQTQRVLPIGDFLGALPLGPFVDREDEIRHLSSIVASTAAGSGHTVLLTGESGAGKTRVAQEVMIKAIGAGFVVGTGRCRESGGRPPFYPLSEALASLRDAAPPDIQRQLPKSWPEVEQFLVRDSRNRDTQRTRPSDAAFTSAVVAFVGAITDSGPVAILIDDLQWADDRTLAFLLNLARRTQDLPVLLAGTYTEGNLGEGLTSLLRDLGRERLAERIALPRLSADGTAALVNSLMGQGGASQEFTDFVHRRTGGNPHAIDRMIRSLGGRLKLINEIGAGGMGRVFRAVDSATGRTVAAKIMFAHGDVDLDTLLRFQQEGAVLSTLKHPNIVSVYGAFLEEQASCIIMEMLEGRPLGQVVAVEKVTLGRARGILQQVASALSYAHSRGIVHRDIKPDNIMVLANDQVKVTDFGIARVARPEGSPSITTTGVTVGTPLYMAPEQIEGKKVDGRADIYSLGAVMYQMVTGHPPFEGESALTVAVKHLSQEPRPPRELNASIPPDWQAVIMKALAKDPEDRFKTASEMERAIAALGGAGSAAGPQATAVAGVRDAGLPGAGSPVEPARPRSEGADAGTAGSSASAVPAQPEPGSARRLPWLPIGAGGALLAVLVVAALVYFGSSHSPKPAPTPTRSSGGQQAGSVTPLQIWAPTGSSGLRNPSALAIGPNGALFVADARNDRVQELSAGGGAGGQWGSPGTEIGQVQSPGGLARSSNGNIYVADTGNDRIEELSPKLQLVRVWGSRGSGESQFDHPSGVAVDSQGNVYVADTNNNRIEEFGPKGGYVAAFGTAGSGQGQFIRPRGVAVDGQGNVFVADTGNNRIQELASSSDPLNQWGARGTAVGMFDHPEGVALDGAGNLYVADTGNNRIEVLNPNSGSSKQLSRLAAQPPELQAPRSVAVDAKGDVYIVDTGHGRVVKVGPIQP